MKLRFLGIEADVAGQALKLFGQPIQMPDEEAHAAIVHNLPVLPDPLFMACGFTDAELKQFATPVSRIRPDLPGPAQDAFDAFEPKWRLARIKLHELRESLKNPVESEPAKTEGVIDNG